MLKISAENPRKQILTFVKAWIKLLADNCFQEACEILEHPNSYGIIWTPDLIKNEINEVFSPDSMFYDTHPKGPIITNPYELEEQRFTEVIALNDRSGYAFDYQLSLNNEWSDLTAQFEFIKCNDEYEVILNAFHIL